MKVPVRYERAQVSDLKGLDEKIRLCRNAVLGGHSLFLHGPCGTGKTHLAIGLAKEWAKLNSKFRYDDDNKLITAKDCPAFIISSSLKDELKRTFNDSDLQEEDVKRKYIEKPLLILDELGIGTWSDWAKEAFYDIINRRHYQEAPMIVTSNLGLGELSRVIDDRIPSRLCGMGLVMTLGEQDYRIKQAEALKKELKGVKL
jgi:DNA replication protein DnaC